MSKQRVLYSKASKGSKASKASKGSKAYQEKSYMRRPPKGKKGALGRSLSERNVRDLNLSKRQFKRSNAYRTMFDSREEWETALKDSLDKKLKPIISDDKERKKYFTPEAMDIWTAAFTHESVDERMEYNYETLEYIGDRALKYAFGEYMSQRFPEADQKMLTAAETTYMSKTFQPQFSKRLGLAKFVLIRGSYVPDDIQEDLFEAFMGALNNVSNQIQFLSGIINVYNFIVHFFRDFRFDLTGESGNIAKTNFTQIFTRFGLDIVEGMSTWTVTEEDGSGVFTIRATPRMIELLGSNKPGRGFNIQLRSSILGQARGKRESEVEKVAYQQALKTLRSYGITPETATAMKEQADFFDESILPLIPAMREKLRRDGLSVAFFSVSKNKKTTPRKILYLNAENMEGEKTVLKSTILDIGTNISDSKRRLVEEYIGTEVSSDVTIEPPPTSNEISPDIDIVSSEEAILEEKSSKRSKPTSSKRSKPKKTKSSKKSKPSQDKQRLSFEEGFLTPQDTVPNKKELQAMKIKELREILKEMGLKVSGRKAELIERILEE